MPQSWFCREETLTDVRPVEEGKEVKQSQQRYKSLVDLVHIGQPSDSLELLNRWWPHLPHSLLLAVLRKRLQPPRVFLRDVPVRSCIFELLRSEVLQVALPGATFSGAGRTGSHFLSFCNGCAEEVSLRFVPDTADGDPAFLCLASTTSPCRLRTAYAEMGSQAVLLPRGVVGKARM